MKKTSCSYSRRKVYLLLIITCTTAQFSIAQNTNASSNSNAQVTRWKINGNNASAGDYLGTNNNQSLILRSNFNDVLRLTPNQETRVMGDMFLEQEIDPSNLDGRFLTVNASGKLVSMEHSGLLEAIYSTPCLSSGDGPGGTSYASPIWSSESVPNNQTGYLHTGSSCPAYVGINTDTPTRALDVRGWSYISGYAGFGVQPNNTTQLNISTNRPVGLQVEHNYISGTGYAFKSIVNNEFTKGIALYNNIYENDVFTVYGNGRIEVSNDAGKIFQLESDGLLRTRRIKVDLDSWADFVFDTDYALMPLESLEAYIIKERHLPNVPSEEELNEDGLDVAEMDKIMMQKIEELTLYTIEQNKLIKELQEKVNQLENNDSE